ncbi:hypothetical protein HDU93_001607 [Gonapodya sp. JEL0774]|nr:hypothetical protein HDU93_001607 [Gonapodya sp. JEL0774]
MPPVRESSAESPSDSDDTKSRKSVDPRERNKIAQKAWRLRKQREQFAMRSKLEESESLSTKLQAENILLREENKNLASQVRLLTNLIVRLSSDNPGILIPTLGDNKTGQSAGPILGQSPSADGQQAPSPAPSSTLSSPTNPNLLVYEQSFGVDPTVGTPQAQTFNIEPLLSKELLPDEQRGLRQSFSKTWMGEAWVNHWNPYSTRSVKPTFFHDWPEWPASTIAALDILANHVAEAGDAANFDFSKSTMNGLYSSPPPPPLDVTKMATPDLYSILLPTPPETYATLNPELRSSFIELTGAIDKKTSPCPILRSKLRETRRFLVKMEGVEGDGVDVMDLLDNLETVAEDYRNEICLNILNSMEISGITSNV